MDGLEDHRSRFDRAVAEVSHTVHDHIFTVETRYRDLKAVGKGSYGIVCSALDTKNNKRVAIKKITPMAHATVDAKHVLREIRLMRYLGVHPNIISLEDIFVRERDDELYIVMELLDSDLHRIIQSPQPLSDAHHRYFMFQLLNGVKFLHDNRIIHRDLKPGNLLVTKSCQLRITDFGLARERPLGRGLHPDEEVDDPMTEHVITRWYRPPELMLCPDGLYTYAVDLWSIGCIFAELLGRKPLFPGSNFVDQLSLIFDVVGSPAPQEVAHIRNNQARRFLDSMAGKPKVPYKNLFPDASEQAVDLLESVLVFDPPVRATVADALIHPYFSTLRGSDGLQANPPVALGLEFEFENSPNMQRLQLKQLILQEVDSFRREQRRKDRDKERDRLLAGNSATGHEYFRGSGPKRMLPKENMPFPRTKSEFSGAMHQYQSNRAPCDMFHAGPVNHNDQVIVQHAMQERQPNHCDHHQPFHDSSATTVQDQSIMAPEINRERMFEEGRMLYEAEQVNRTTLMRAYSAGQEMEVRDRIGTTRAPVAGTMNNQHLPFGATMYMQRSPIHKRRLWNHVDQSALSDDDTMDSIGEKQAHISSSIPVANWDESSHLDFWGRSVHKEERKLKTQSLI